MAAGKESPLAAATEPAIKAKGKIPSNKGATVLNPR